jgi:hypothetical protein
MCRFGAFGAACHEMRSSLWRSLPASVRHDRIGLRIEASVATQDLEGDREGSRRSARPASASSTSKRRKLLANPKWASTSGGQPHLQASNSLAVDVKRIGRHPSATSQQPEPASRQITKDVAQA